MYYKECKEAIESEKNVDAKNAMMEDVICSLFDVIGTLEQFKLTGQDSEFLQKCFEQVKRVTYEEGCVKGYRNCINDHTYVKDQHAVKTNCEMLAQCGHATKEVENSFREMVMNRFMKRT